MRLVEVRLLDGPNVYRLEPAVKLELAIGRRRTWYGQRRPERHSVVRLGARVRLSDVPPSVARTAAWVRRLHTVALGEPRKDVAVHRTSEPGHWVISFTWRERGRSERLATAAFRLAERGLEPARSSPPPHVVRRIRDADTSPPEWVTDDRRRVPIVSISGTNGKSTTTRMIAHILHTSGRRIGMTTTEGVFVDGRSVEEGDLTGPYGAHSVLTRDDVDMAVLETARGGIVLRGVGYQSNEASVLTNVSPDHLDLHGLHTVPELAEVKSVICRVTRPSGAVVLNAEDPLVAAVGRTVQATVVFFSLRPGNARVRRHVRKGGRAVVLQDGWITELEGDRRRRIVRASEVPATIGGLARHNIANALAAVGGARAMGATLTQVADGLRDFRPTSDQMPGRMNIYRLGRRVVVVDYAHNEAGLEALFDLAEGLVGPRRRRFRRATISAIIGAAGDRPDDVLRAIGRIAGSRADEIAIRIGPRYLRGRTEASLTGTLLGGVREGGGDPSAVPLYEQEHDSLEAELTTDGRLAASDDGPPRVVLLMCHTNREKVRAVLDRLGATPIEEPGGLAKEMRSGPRK
ncbi:MAG TPA: Mur ligase family protein [Candidatus Limnocylindrales bacterium]|nr:Mur ligase family protein [Candidatus Limnocylindrales bacterium]